MRVGIAVLTVLGVATLVVVAPACGAFSGSDDAPASAARAVKCDEAECSGEDFCCVHNNSKNVCTSQLRRDPARM